MNVHLFVNGLSRAMKLTNNHKMFLLYPLFKPLRSALTNSVLFITSQLLIEENKQMKADLYSSNYHPFFSLSVFYSLCWILCLFEARSAR